MSPPGREDSSSQGSHQGSFEKLSAALSCAWLPPAGACRPGGRSGQDGLTSAGCRVW